MTRLYLPDLQRIICDRKRLQKRDFLERNSGRNRIEIGCRNGDILRKPTVGMNSNCYSVIAVIDVAEVTEFACSAANNRLNNHRHSFTDVGDI